MFLIKSRYSCFFRITLQFKTDLKGKYSLPITLYAGQLALGGSTLCVRDAHSWAADLNYPPGCLGQDHHELCPVPLHRAPFTQNCESQSLCGFGNQPVGHGQHLFKIFIEVQPKSRKVHTSKMYSSINFYRLNTPMEPAWHEETEHC